MASQMLRLLVVAASAMRVTASCAYGTHLQPRQEGEVKVSTFGYDGVNGPTNWIGLDPANILCATGVNQSPINMAIGQFTLEPGDSIALALNDLPEGGKFENLGTTVEVVHEMGGTMSIGGITYMLQQFHFHLPSEHLDNGTSMAMEMHMVWQGPNQEVAVIGVFIDLDPEAGAAAAPAPAPAGEPLAAEGAAPPPPEGEAPPPVRRSAKMSKQIEARHEEEKRQFITLVPPPSAETPAPAPVPAPAPAPAGQEPAPVAPVVTQNAAVSPAQAPSVLLETVFQSVGAISTPGSFTTTQPLVLSELVSTLSAGMFQSYQGSLTTPPCSEGVQWLVATQKLVVSTASFEAVRQVIGFNSRFPQNDLGQTNLLQMANIAIQQATSGGAVAAA